MLRQGKLHVDALAKLLQNLADDSLLGGRHKQACNAYKDMPLA